MKKVLFILICSFITSMISAHNSFDIRVGAGYNFLSIDDYYYGDRYSDQGIHIAALAQPNFTFKKDGKWTISPALKAELYEDPDLYKMFANLSVLLGYRAKIGNQKYFFPKVGPRIGAKYFDNQFSSKTQVGIAADLALEFNHFLIGIDGYYPLGVPYDDVSISGVSLTIGTKIYRNKSKNTKSTSSTLSTTSSVQDHTTPELLHSGTYYFNEGMTEYHSGNYSKAVSHFRECMKYDDIVGDNRSKARELIKECEEEITKRSNEFWANWNESQANEYFQNGKYKKAALYYGKAFELNHSGVSLYNRGISFYNRGDYNSAIQDLTGCLEYDDVSSSIRENAIKLAEEARSLQQEKIERRALILSAIAQGLSDYANSQANNTYTSNTYSNSSVSRMPITPTSSSQKSLGRTDDDDDDDDDHGISDVKIKCLECGGSGKCRQSGIVDARTTRCGGSGKCPMCNGKGKSHTKCGKCKGKGCATCDDSGFVDCTACKGSGECDHCDGTGKCPRCGGTGKE